MSDEVIWPDLQRYGAALKIVRDSPMRGTPLSCLVITDLDAFEAACQASCDAVDGGGYDQFRASWYASLEGLGFASRPHVVLDPESGARTHYFYSARLDFELADLQTIVPGVRASDFVSVPTGHVVLLSDPHQLGHIDEWKAFAARLRNENNKVLVPIESPFDVAYSDALPLSSAKPRGGHPLFRGDANAPQSTYRLAMLDQTGYRSNALVGFYPTRGMANAAGYADDELRVVDLPYAAPMWVEGDGRVVALRDIRYIPEALMQAPGSLFDVHSARSQSGLAVSVLRAAEPVTAAVNSALPAFLAACAAHPLDLSVIYESLHSIQRTVGEFSDAFGRIRRPKDWFEKDVDQPIERWTEAHFSYAVEVVYPFVSRVEYEQLQECMKQLQRDIVKTLNAGVVEQSREALRLIAQGVEEPVGTVSRKHDDVGEKIGGARKDFHRRGLTLDDYDQMNDLERQSLVLKKNIWPSIDYDALREAGVKADVAMRLKVFKDSVNTAPSTCVGGLESSAALYITAVTIARDAMAQVSTVDEFDEACKAIHRGIMVDDAGVHDPRQLYGSSLSKQLGVDACYVLAGIRSGASTMHRALRRVKNPDDWTALIKRKAERVETPDDERRRKALEDIEYPHLESITRSGGPDWRSGRNVNGEDLLQHFGFRGVEWGNWVVNDERQVVLNMAFDGLCDLALALDLPPQALSLDGQLALAFGARGSGGRRAALAHYEPLRNVINLTRLSGAGSLCHEWFHAYDFHLGEGKAYQSDVQSHEAMGRLVGSMLKRPSDVDEMIEANEKLWARHTQWAGSWVDVKRDLVRPYLERSMQCLKDMLEDTARSEPEALILRAHTLEESGVTGIHQGLVREIGGISSQKKRRYQFEANLGTAVRSLIAVVYLQAAKEQGFTPDRLFCRNGATQETAFLASALRLDETRSKPYWATPRELFARAGEQYVFYQLQDKGIQSDFLVHGVESERYASNEVGNPYPDERDRQQLKPFFDGLIESYRVEHAKLAAGAAPDQELS